MNEQVPFIGREEELQRIDRLIREWGTFRLICIQAGGGIGKTRLLQEVRERYPNTSSSPRMISNIIDFDDRTLHLLPNLGYKIATEMDEYEFQPYLRGVIEHRKLELQGRNYACLRESFLKNFQVFYDCFNRITETKRSILLFDTTDALQGTIWVRFFTELGESLHNTLVLLAGRNAKKFGEQIQEMLEDDKAVEILQLHPLHEDVEAHEYLERKQELLHITLEHDMAEKLLLLAGGKPILLDLAVEWRARGISLDWLIHEDTGTVAQKLEKRKEEFERHMVSHIAQCRRQIDDLILVLARVYPLNAEMIAVLLDISPEEANRLFQDAQTYVFVKSLPDGRISLHDEMRRMVNEYVWDEADPEGDRRRHESQLVTRYLEKKIAEVAAQIHALEAREKALAEQRRTDETQGSAEANQDNTEEEYEIFAQRERLEREMWILKLQHLQHTFVVDFSQGIQVFATHFDDATQKRQFSFRESLLRQMTRYHEVLSDKPEERYMLDKRRLTYLFDKSKYAEADELAATMLREGSLKNEQYVNTLIRRANIKIRLGQVTLSLEDFKSAVDFSETHGLSIWHIKALNGLGWAYRQSGDLDLAQRHYREARHLYFTVNEEEKRALEDDFGWISNNLSFVLSNNNQTRRTAINIARSNLQHWESIGNEIGLGACYLVLGVAYYRYDAYDRALEAFQLALNIFRPLGLNDWLGQIYSWRGALYRDMKDVRSAERDLKQSLEIGSSNIEAMTRYCLGRVAMRQQDWEQAKHYFHTSLERAQRMSDFRYWLASVVRLIQIAAEQGEFQRLDEFTRTLIDCLRQIKTPEKNAHGMAYMGLAKLAFMHNDRQKEALIIKYLKRGIALINKSYYAHADVLTHVESIEAVFEQISPELIRAVGNALFEFSSAKERDKVDYCAVTPLMDAWATWGEKEESHE